MRRVYRPNESIWAGKYYGRRPNNTSFGAETRFRLSEKGLVQEPENDIPKYIFGALLGAGLLWLGSNLTFKSKARKKFKGSF